MINKSDNESCPEGYVLPAGQNSSPRMKFNSQTTPLTTFSLLLTICHVAQIHTFRLVAPMAVPTNLRIGTEHKKWGWGAFHKRKEKGYHSNSEGLFLACVSCLDFILQYKWQRIGICYLSLPFFKRLSQNLS